MLRSKLHRPWQPRMDDGQIFNPFAHTTEPEAGLTDHQDLPTEEPGVHGADWPQRDEELVPTPQRGGS